jgi:hypothetical protein
MVDEDRRATEELTKQSGPAPAGAKKGNRKKSKKKA